MELRVISSLVLAFLSFGVLAQNMQTEKAYSEKMTVFNYLKKTPFNNGMYKSGKKLTFTPKGSPKPTKIVKLEKGFSGSRLIPYNGSLVHVYLPDAKVMNTKTFDQQILWLTERDQNLKEINSFKFSEIKQKIGSVKFIGIGAINTKIPFTNDLVKSDQDSFLLFFAEKVSVYPDEYRSVGTNFLFKDLDKSREIAFFTLFNHRLKVLTSGNYDFGIEKGFVKKRHHHLFNDGTFLMGIKHYQINSEVADGWKFAFMDKESNVTELLVSLNEFNMMESHLQIEGDRIFITGIASEKDNLKKPIGVFKIELDKKTSQIKEKIVVKFKDELISVLHKDIKNKYLYFQSSSVRTEDGYCYFTIRKISTMGMSAILGEQYVLNLNKKNNLTYFTHGGGMAIKTNNTGYAFNDGEKAYLMFSSFGKGEHPHYAKMDKCKNWQEVLDKFFEKAKNNKLYYIIMNGGDVFKEGFVVDYKGAVEKGSLGFLINHNIHPGKFIFNDTGRMLKIE